jgi:hypothetical protein
MKIASIPGGPGAEQMPKGILQGIAAKQPAIGQMGPDPSVIFDETFGGQKIPYNAMVASDPYKNYNVADTYKQSDFYDNSMNSQGYLDFLQDARDNFMKRDMQMDGKSAAYNDARSKIFDAYDTFNPVTNIAEQEAYYAANPNTLGGIGNVRKYDDGFFLEPIPRGGFVPGGGLSEVSIDPVDDYADNTDFFNNMHGAKPFPGINNDFGPNSVGPVTPQQPTGGFDSKAFANELLTGIGDLFKQHFPESAQMAFNNSNQMQSQIEQPIQDATTFDVQPQQNTAYNPFSVNTIGGAFGGGY